MSAEVAWHRVGASRCWGRAHSHPRWKEASRGALFYPPLGQLACVMELERSGEDFIWHTWFYVRHRGLVRQGHLYVIEGCLREKGKT